MLTCFLKWPIYGFLGYCSSVLLMGGYLFSLGNAIAINIMLNIEGLNFIRLE